MQGATGSRRGQSSPRRLRWCVAPCIGLLLTLSGCMGAPGGAPRLPASDSAEPQRCDVSNDSAAKLGANLFFDARLSEDQDLSCASCHDPRFSFTDREALALGRSGRVLKRHAPALINLGHARSFFWDGRAASLEEQARAVITNPFEFGSDFPLIVRRLRETPSYSESFKSTYAGKGINEKTILAALAAFERRIVALSSPYDRFLAGNADELSKSAQRGFALFDGRALCSKCHSGRDLTDRRFHNTGVETDDLGRIGIVRNTDFQTRPYPFFANHKAFKTPSLRNVALTAPYFHSGSEATLADVIAFYAQGGRAEDDYGRSPDVRPFDMSDEDRTDLVAFLQSLSSEVDFCRPDEAAIVRGRSPSARGDIPPATTRRIP